MPFMYRVLKCVHTSRPPIATSYFFTMSAGAGVVFASSAPALPAVPVKFEVATGCEDVDVGCGSANDVCARAALAPNIPTPTSKHKTPDVFMNASRFEPGLLLTV